MKQAFVLVWLFGLLALGMAGCGNSSYSTGVPEAPATERSR